MQNEDLSIHQIVDIELMENSLRLMHDVEYYITLQGIENDKLMNILIVSVDNENCLSLCQSADELDIVLSWQFIKT